MFCKKIIKFNNYLIKRRLFILSSETDDPHVQKYFTKPENEILPKDINKPIVLLHYLDI